MKDLFLVISNQIHDVITLCDEDPSIYSFERQNKYLFDIKKNCELLETIDVREHYHIDILKNSENWILYLLSIICPDRDDIYLSEPCPEPRRETDPCPESVCSEQGTESDHVPCNSYPVINCPIYYPDFCPDYYKSKYNSVIIPTSNLSETKKEQNRSPKLCRKKLNKLLEIIKLENLARLTNKPNCC